MHARIAAFPAVPSKLSCKRRGENSGVTTNLDPLIVTAFPARDRGALARGGVASPTGAIEFRGLYP